MRPVLDGHNDALTANDHAGLASGKTGGHLDLPRMRAGGVRGAIFAVFADGPDGDLPGDDASAATEGVDVFDQGLAADDPSGLDGRG